MCFCVVLLQFGFLFPSFPWFNVDKLQVFHTPHPPPHPLTPPPSFPATIVTENVKFGTPGKKELSSFSRSNTCKDANVWRVLRVLNVLKVL